jgi:hypothetical protein
MWRFLLLAFYFVTVNVQAVSFHAYTNSSGQTVYSNIPDECVTDGLLTCTHLYPMFQQDKLSTNKSDNVATVPAKQKPKADNETGPQVKRSVSSNLCHDKASVDYSKITNFIPYPSMDECEDSGGEEARR